MGGELLQLALLLLVLILLTKPLGSYIFQVMSPKEKTILDRALKPLEKSLYRLSGVDPFAEQDWKRYLGSLLAFSLVSFLFTFVLLAFQYYLPLNPQKFAAPSWHLNLNTSISFMTNTNWQSYGGESTMSYFSQMAALAVQNFTSAAVGLAAAGTLVRGLSLRSAKTVGNFWADLIRITVYLLLPLSVVSASFLISEGVPQNFTPYVQAETLDGGRIQSIAQGPIASQEAIKMLGTNGGGFMNANSAHPYENPTPFSNFFEMVLILLIPCAQIYYFGKSVKDTKHAWCIFAALAVVFAAGVAACAFCEFAGNPEFAKLGLTEENWEGKEQRFGLFGSSLFACVTTVVSCGAVNCAHDCLTPIGGLVPMLNMQLSEVIFGGVGAGLYSVLLFVFLAIFISGLIIGRTPEYLGKKISTREIQLTVLAVIPYVLVVHVFTAWCSSSAWGIQGLGNTGPHGFSEILYAFSSCAANNGSAFGGLSANVPIYNLTLAAAMLLGRFLVLAPVIALAGSLASQSILPKTTGSFPVSSLVFISLLIGIILLLGALTFFPALAMGPIIEQFFMLKGALSS